MKYTATLLYVLFSGTCSRVLLAEAVYSIHRSGLCKKRVDAKCYCAEEHQFGDDTHILDEACLACALCAGRVDRRDICGCDLYRERCLVRSHWRVEGIVTYSSPPRQDNPAT